MGIGRFVRWKGFDYLLDAFAHASTAHPELRLALVGDGDLRGELTERARSLGIADVVTFTGMVARDRMPAYLGAADIVTVPSIHYDGYVDGLPNVALEALATGSALVATRVGGFRSWCARAKTASSSTRRCAGALAGAIAQLAADTDLRERIGENGRRHIAESRTWEDVAARFESVFELACRAERSWLRPAPGDRTIDD